MSECYSYNYLILIYLNIYKYMCLTFLGKFLPLSTRMIFSKILLYDSINYLEIYKFTFKTIF